MIQVLGLREASVTGVLKRKKYREVFFSKQWRFKDISEVFDAGKRAELLANVPEKEHYNLFFTGLS